MLQLGFWCEFDDVSEEVDETVDVPHPPGSKCASAGSPASGSYCSDCGQRRQRQQVTCRWNEEWRGLIATGDVVVTDRSFDGEWCGTPSMTVHGLECAVYQYCVDTRTYALAEHMDRGYAWSSDKGTVFGVKIDYVCSGVSPDLAKWQRKKEKVWEKIKDGPLRHSKLAFL